jgi:hypothetical protein
MINHPICSDCFCDIRRVCKGCGKKSGYWLYNTYSDICDICVENYIKARQKLTPYAEAMCGLGEIEIHL